MSTDAVIMLRRNIKHTLRNPVTVVNAVLLPIVIMLMFVYMLGDAFSVGVKYIDYATPGMILLAVSYGLGATATEVSDDMTKGIINRFKVMDVSRGAVMTGHVIVTMTRSLISIAAIIGVAFGLGFRPSASFGGWLAVIGIIVAACFATSWLTVAMGLAAKTPQSAGLATVPLIMLPFFSSAIVPAAKMGQGVRQFAQYQPFTPIIESLRGLLTGHPSAGYTIAALAWCAGIGIAGYAWALSTFKKRA
jgi:ABC-2 type transport system permease protein